MAKLTENKPHSVHLRLSEEQWQFCAGNAELMGIGVSDFVRMIINTMAVTSKKAQEAAQSTLGNLGGNYENATDNQ